MSYLLINLVRWSAEKSVLAACVVQLGFNLRTPPLCAVCEIRQLSGKSSITVLQHWWLQLGFMRSRCNWWVRQLVAVLLRSQPLFFVRQKPLLWSTKNGRKKTHQNGGFTGIKAGDSFDSAGDSPYQAACWSGPAVQSWSSAIVFGEILTAGVSLQGWLVGWALVSRWEATKI